ncbi:MAG: DUF6089 family protein [Chitinophagaceae bacterium]
MKHRFLILACCFASLSALSQGVHIGLFGGLAAYNGELTDKIFPKKVTNGAIGLTANYELTDHIMLRAGLTYSVLGSADRYSKNVYSLKRNLSFETSLLEFSVVGEYYLLNLNESRYSPYAFAGIAAFHFNPYTYTATGQKVFLKPLSTEGQGLNGYPDRKPYSLTQVAFPVGGGIKFVITDGLRIGIEGGLRKLLTDYLDDVSKNYIDPADLLAAKGQLAVDLSYRGDEVIGGSPVYPSKSDQRGNFKNKDIYYFAGIHLTYKLGSGGGSGFGGGGRKSRTGCPTNVY